MHTAKDPDPNVSPFRKFNELVAVFLKVQKRDTNPGFWTSMDQTKELLALVCIIRTCVDCSENSHMNTLQCAIALQWFVVAAECDTLWWISNILR